VASILFVYSRPARFVEIDLDALRERWEVETWEQPGRLANPLRAARAVRRNDLVVGWFASWHTFWPITLAVLLRKPSLLIVGGFDTADMPEIGYGYQRGGPQRSLSRWVMKRAGQLMTNSDYSRGELERNVGIPAEHVRVVHHGVPDPFGSAGESEREPIVLTVSNVARLSLERKGLRAFVEAAALVPEAQFVLVGEWTDDAIDDLRVRAAANVTFTGHVPRAELDDWFRRASVYVQASRHEGFGMAVAEAMLAGCIPVVTEAGALPEVVGDAGVQIPGHEAQDVAGGVRRALELGPPWRVKARERVVSTFPLAKRVTELQGIVRNTLTA
jgi:glycosyltransferase involved in cell wall biosynthesis